MACNSINSTLEAFTIAILCVLIAAVLLKEKKDSGDKFLLAVALLHTINTLGDLVSWRFAGKPGSFSLVMTTVGNYATYLFSVFAYTGFMALVYGKITDKRCVSGIGRIFAVLIGLCSVFLALLILTNHWTGALYSLSADNTFTWGRWCTVFDNTVLLQMALLLVLILTEQRGDIKGTAVQLGLYLCIPMVAVIVENWFSVLMLLCPAVAISLLLIYINSQREQEKKMLEQDKKLLRQENSLLKQEQELTESNAALMMSQIQPHFLFNSLNSIYHLCDIDVQKAKQAVGDFSEYLRENLKALNIREPISFETELNHVKNYLSLEKVRFGEELRIIYDIQTVDFFLPQLTVQPIVENAVRHGLGDSIAGGTVTIATRELPDCFEITVSDDGMGFDAAGLSALDTADGKHVGIRNVKSRLHDMCGATLEIESRPRKGTLATIRIPKEGKEDENTCS